MVHEEAIDVLREIRAGLPKGVVALLGTVRWLGKGERKLQGTVEDGRVYHWWD